MTRASSVGPKGCAWTATHEGSPTLWRTMLPVAPSAVSSACGLRRPREPWREVSRGQETAGRRAVGRSLRPKSCARRIPTSSTPPMAPKRVSSYSAWSHNNVDPLLWIDPHVLFAIDRRWRDVDPVLRCEAGLEPLTMRCVDSFPTKDDVGQEYWCLILEWLDASLFDLVRSNGNRGLHLSMVRTLLRQLLEQLKVLQDLDCTHTDIKHKNCCLVSTEHYMAPSSDGATMILSDPMAKFIDYGNAVFEGAPKPHPIHTKQFRAPEVLLKVHGGWGPASDTWTLGVTGCFLVSGQLIFNSHDPQELLRLMGQACGAFPPRLLLAAEDARMRRCAENIQAPRQPQLASWLNLDRKGPAEAACADLLLNMLALDPSERISASDALCHPFLAENGEGAKVPVPPQGQLPLRRL
ncbi:unnamed protein product [Durusdinium trenchii]|uniref:Protein kinase domain-containing protein n=1 Tax=Durusdinium trenchii TaxID=1381693 RepID=A0ABP0QAL2_9DINO